MNIKVTKNMEWIKSKPGRHKVGIVWDGDTAIVVPPGEGECEGEYDDGFLYSRKPSPDGFGVTLDGNWYLLNVPVPVPQGPMSLELTERLSERPFVREKIFEFRTLFWQPRDP